MADYSRLARALDAWGEDHGAMGEEMVARMRHRAVADCLWDDSVGSEKIADFIATRPQEYVYKLGEVASRGSVREFQAARTPERALADELTELVLAWNEPPIIVVT